MRKDVLSIVIPCYNSERTLRQTIDSVLKQVLPERINLELIAVDNNSIDSTKDIILSYPSINYVFEEKRNRSQARNRGVRESSGEFIVFLDSDTILSENWLLQMFHKINSSPLYGGGEGHIDSGSLSRTNYIERLRSRSKEKSHRFVEMRGRRYPGINTAACIYKKSILLELGSFDESLNYHEDIDLSRRVYFSGKVLFSEPKATATCYNASTSLLSFAKRYFVSGKEFRAYALKWKKHMNSSLVGLLLATLKNTLSACYQELYLRKDPKVFFARALFYQLFFYGYVFGSILFSVRKVVSYRKSPKPMLIDQSGEWGLVETPKKYILYNFKTKEFKSYMNVLPLDSFLLKMKREETVELRNFLLSLDIKPYNISLVGSHVEGFSKLSRKDIDVIIIAKDRLSLELIEDKLKNLKPILSERLDISCHELSSVITNNIFYNKGIRVSRYALKHALCLYGEKIPIQDNKLDKDGLHIFNLFLKKLKYFSLELQVEGFAIESHDNMDCIILYKFISALDYSLEEEEGFDIDQHYEKNLSLFSSEEREFLNYCVSKSFCFHKKKYQESLELLLSIMSKSVSIFLEKFEDYIQTLELESFKTKLSSRDHDKNFLGREVKNSDYCLEYIEVSRRTCERLRRKYLC